MTEEKNKITGNLALPIIKKTGICHTGKVIKVELERNRVICAVCSMYLGDIKRK